jgi:ABC-type nickel/cobalt efflux system permease component RcnA
MPSASRLLQILAWLLLLALAIVTVGPIGLRPETSLSPQLERTVGLLIVGFAFGLAYPRRIVLVALLLFTSTALFEVLQNFEPHRHGRWIDLAVKLIGAALGLLLGWLASRRRVQ